MGIHALAKPVGVRWVLFFASLLLFSACVTEDKFLYLSKRIDAIEAKTDKELLSNSERMAVNSSRNGPLKEEMRFLNGRLDENSHLLKRSIERDTTERDVRVFPICGNGWSGWNYGWTGFPPTLALNP
jgi:hypothetical protein